MGLLLCDAARFEEAGVIGIVIQSRGLLQQVCGKTDACGISISARGE